MKTLINVLKFIELMNVSTRKFEVEANLPNGTIGGAEKRKAELTPDVINKIVERYSTELTEYGFHIIDFTTIGVDVKAIFNSEEIARFRQYDLIIDNKGTDSIIVIELKTASGKDLKIKPENATEVALLNAFLAEKEDRQKDIEQRALKAEKEKDRLYSVIEQNLTTLLKITGQIDANSKVIADDLNALVTEIQAEHRAMMDSIDVAAKQKIGTTRAKSRTVEIASHEAHSKKDKKVVSGKKD